MSSTTTRGALTTVAATGLPGTSLRWPERPLAEPLWSSLLTAAPTHRVTGHLVAAIETGRLPATQHQFDQAAGAHIDAMNLAVRLERNMALIVGQLEEAKVETRVLKGPASAHLDYPDPSLRSFGDIDLLVRSGDFDRATSVLTGHGHLRRYPEPRPGFDRRFSKGASFQTTAGWEVDLHRTFVMGPFGLSIDLDDLWGQKTEFEVGGRGYVALGPEMRFLHACYHAALGDVVPRLVPQRDVAGMALAQDLDTDRVIRVATRWNGRAVLARGVSLAWATFEIADVTALSSWAARYRATDRESRDLALYSTTSHSYAAKSLAAVRVLPGWRSRLDFVRALVMPDRSYVSPRHGGPARRLRKGVRDIRRSRGGP